MFKHFPPLDELSSLFVSYYQIFFSFIFSRVVLQCLSHHVEDELNSDAECDYYQFVPCVDVTRYTVSPYKFHQVLFTFGYRGVGVARAE